MDIKQTVSNLVSNAKLDQALEEFIKWAGENNKDLNNQLLLTKGRLNGLKRQENLGLIGFSEAARDRAQIANAILEMTSQIDESSPNSSDSSSPPSTSKGSTTANSGNTITTNDTILFLASNPVDTSELDLNEEFVKIHTKLQNSKYKLNSAWAVTADSLQDAILNYEPRILHFSGHGSGSGGSAGGAGTRAIGRVTKSPAGIYVKNEDTGTKQMISGNALAGLFKVCRKIFNLEVVLLNACHSKEQAQAIFGAGIPYVIGMNTAVYDETAIEFAASFYRGLAKRGNVEIAFELAVASIALNDLKGVDTPVLYKK
jgi:CHAT domain/Effector-associated domain 11